MEKAPAALKSTPPSVSDGSDASLTQDSPSSLARASRQRNQFLGMALNMSWQLAVVVLVPVVGGVFIDKGFHTSPIFLCIGLALALAGTVVVLWRTMQVANKLPVPKLSDTERRAIQKQYEEDDD